MDNKHKYSCVIHTKETLDEMGFEEGHHDYEVKMVGKPDAHIIQGAFQVYGEIAIILNEEKTHYLMFEMNDPKNKDIWFERLNPPIQVVSKAQVWGATINTAELIEGLKNTIFEDDAPIMVHTKNCAEPLTLVYKCNECEKLHLLGGYSDHEVFNNMIEEAEKVYINKLYKDEDDECVTRKELLDILESIQGTIPVLIDSVGEVNAFTLTTVYKCSEKCPVIHLDCTYEKNYHMPN